MLEIQDCCLVVVDVQGKLAQLMVDKEALFKQYKAWEAEQNARAQASPRQR